jgi:galactokinase
MTRDSSERAETISIREISLLYGEGSEVLARQQRRYEGLIHRFLQTFGGTPHSIYSAPGRCEIGGNHTDHNGGHVLAAAIDLDIIAAVSPRQGGVWTVYSRGFERPFQIDTTELEPNESEHPTCQLLRGIAAGFVRRGYELGGLEMLMDSNVLFASGLSSSAALEMLVGTAINGLFNNSSIDIRTLANIGREAEDKYWGKPVGLLDQLSIGTGGVVEIGFENSASPRIECVPMSFSEYYHDLILVNPGGDHSSLTFEYKSIPAEMREVARYFHKERLIEITLEDVLKNVREIRLRCGDRALLRAIHFFVENTRVERQVRALRAGDLPEFIELVRESGSSSWRLLQNCYEADHPGTQPISVALALSEELSDRFDNRLGYRVHGGGFGGTILAIVPRDTTDIYMRSMGMAFGEHAAHRLHIRPYGCVKVQMRAS